MSRRDDQRLPLQKGEAPISRRSTSSSGVRQRTDPRREDEPALGELLPYSFDLRSIIAAPASGTISLLVGNGAPQQMQRIPPRCRAYLDGIAPYLEDATGPVLSTRIAGAGVTITWSVLIDNKPTDYYGAMTTLADPWGYLAPRPLVEIPEGKLLTVQVTNVDPGALYKFLGIRIRGRWVPVKRDKRGRGV